MIACQPAESWAANTSARPAARPCVFFRYILKNSSCTGNTLTYHSQRRAANHIEEQYHHEVARTTTTRVDIINISRSLLPYCVPAAKSTTSRSRFCWAGTNSSFVDQSCQTMAQTIWFCHRPSTLRVGHQRRTRCLRCGDECTAACKEFAVSRDWPAVIGHRRSP